MPGPGTYGYFSRPAGNLRPDQLKRVVPKSPKVWDAEDAADNAMSTSGMSGEMPNKNSDQNREDNDSKSEVPSLQWLVNSENEPREHIVLHGSVLAYVGENTQGDYLYEYTNGLRVAISESGLELFEAPFVAPDGTFEHPPNRAAEFMLSSDLAAQLASSGDNIESIFGSSSDGLEQEFTGGSDLLWETLGDNKELLTSAINSYIVLRAYEDKGVNSFILNRYQNDFDNAYQALSTGIANLGLHIDYDRFKNISEIAYERTGTRIDRILTEMTALELNNKASQAPSVRSVEILEMNPDTAKAIPAYLIRETLDRISRDNTPATWSLLVAKVYGTGDEVSQATKLVKQPNAEQATSFAEQMHEKYNFTRSVVEIPNRIEHLKEAIANDTNLSPIPRDNMRTEVSKLYRELAKSIYDIDGIIIDERDEEIYRASSSFSQGVSEIAQKHLISEDAARLYMDRVEASLSEKAHDKFLVSPEYIAGVRAAKIISDKLGESHVLKIGEQHSEPAIKLSWGGGTLSLSRPEIMHHHDGTPYWSITASYSDAGSHSTTYSRLAHEVIYGDMPDAEHIARFLIAFALTNQTNHDYAQIINYPNRYNTGEDDKYNNTAIAKRIREQIKLSIKEGNLPKGLKTSVRKSSGSIHATIKAVPEGMKIYTDEYLAWNKEGKASGNYDFDLRPDKTYTSEGRALLNAIESIRELWNFDNSDRMSDYYHVNYYGETSFDSDIESREAQRVLKTLDQFQEDNSARYQNYHDSIRKLAYQFEENGSCFDSELGLWAGYTLTDDGRLSMTIERNGGTTMPNLSQAEENSSGELVCHKTATTILMDELSAILGLEKEPLKNLDHKARAESGDQHSDSDSIAEYRHDDDTGDLTAIWPGLQLPYDRSLTKNQQLVVDEIDRICRESEGVETAIYTLPHPGGNKDPLLFGYKSNGGEARAWFSVEPNGAMSPLSEEHIQVAEAIYSNYRSMPGYRYPTNDLFEDYASLPEEVQEVLAEFSVSDIDYRACEELKIRLNNLGYTFDYDRSAEPFNLRRLETLQSMAS